MQSLDFETFLLRQEDKGLAGTELGAALDRLPSVSRHGPWLAGDAIRRTILGQELSKSDFDFFFRDAEQMEAFCEDLRDLCEEVVLMSENDKNRTFLVKSIEGKPTLKVQAIFVKYYSDPEELLESFDFTLCQLVYDGYNLLCGDYALWDIGRKRLIPHKITFGVSSLRRMIKYTKQGFAVCSGGLADILNQVVATPDVINSEVKYID